MDPEAYVRAIENDWTEGEMIIYVNPEEVKKITSAGKKVYDVKILDEMEVPKRFEGKTGLRLVKLVTGAQN